MLEHDPCCERVFPSVGGCYPVCEVYAHIQILLVNCERDMQPF